MTDTTYRTVTPYLVVPDADAVITFVTKAFGATEQMCQRNDDGSVMHAEMKIGDSLIMVGQAGDQWKAGQASLYLWIDDVDATYERALAAGADAQSSPEDKPYGHRTAGVVLGGINWWLGAPVRK